MNDYSERMTSQLYYEHIVHGDKDIALFKIIRTVINKLYEIGRFYPEHFIGVIPQTTQQLLKFTKNPTSHVSWNNDAKPSKPEKLFLNIDSGDLNLVWDLLHEYGHLVDGPPSLVEGNELKSLPREQRAWDFGRKELSKYPQYVDSYNLRMVTCIESYRKK